MSEEISSCATSREAGYVAMQRDESRAHLKASLFFGPDASGVFDELRGIYDDCGKPNWDGYGAAAIEEETYRYACQLVWALPPGTRPPSVGAEADGDLTLEWHVSRRRTLSVSVTPEGFLHYAALLGVSSRCGSEPFFGEFPTAILNLIQQVHAP